MNTRSFGTWTPAKALLARMDSKLFSLGRPLLTSLALLSRLHAADPPKEKANIIRYPDCFFRREPASTKFRPARMKSKAKSK